MKLKNLKIDNRSILTFVMLVLSFSINGQNMTSTWENIYACTDEENDTLNELNRMLIENSFDSLSRYNYFVRNNYENLYPWLNINASKLLLERIKYQYNSELLGLLDTAKIHKVLAELNDDPYTDSLLNLYTLTSCNAVVYGQIKDIQYPISKTKCFPLKTLYLIKIDSIIHSSIPNLRIGDHLIGGTLNGYRGSCGDGYSEQKMHFSAEANYTVDQKSIFFLSNSSLVDEHYLRIKENRESDVFFCPDIYRILNLKNKNEIVRDYKIYAW